MRIAAFPAKIARWADADGFNEVFVLHWQKCFSIRSRSKQVRTAAGGTPSFRATPTPALAGVTRITVVNRGENRGRTLVDADS